MKKSSVIILWSVVIAVFCSAYFVVTFEVFEKTSWVYQILSYLVIAAFLLIAKFQFRNKVNGGYVTYGQSFMLGLFIVLIYSALLTVFTIVFVEGHPDFIDKALASRQADMINSGMSQDQIEKGISMAKRLFIPFMAIFGYIINVIVGLIIVVIMSLFGNKEKPFIEEDNNSLPA